MAKPVDAFLAEDGVLFLTLEDAHRHEFRPYLDTLASATPESLLSEMTSAVKGGEPSPLEHAVAALDAFFYATRNPGEGAK